MSAATSSKATITARKNLTKSIPVDRQMTDDLRTIVGDKLQAEGLVRLQESIPFGSCSSTDIELQESAG